MKTYEKLRNELKQMESDKTAVFHRHLREYGKKLDNALKNNQITESQYSRLLNRFMAL